MRKGPPCHGWRSYPKQPMKLQQPRNYDFGVSQFSLLGSQGGNSREMTTSPPGHHWEATVALTTAAKLQQFRANSREMTSQKLNNRCHRSMRFCVVSWLLSFQVTLGILWFRGDRNSERKLSNGWSRSYHSFRYHFIFNLKTIKSCKWHCRKCLRFPGRNSFL